MSVSHDYHMTRINYFNNLSALSSLLNSVFISTIDVLLSNLWVVMGVASVGVSIVVGVVPSSGIEDMAWLLSNVKLLERPFVSVSSSFACLLSLTEFLVVILEFIRCLYLESDSNNLEREREREGVKQLQPPVVL